MAEVRARVRAEVRARLARGGVHEFEDEAIFLAAEHLMARALEQRDRQLLLLPELLDDEDDWRVNPSLRLSSHRPIAGGAIIWLKQKLVLPVTRWLYDYSRENFARQERLNFVLMACAAATGDRERPPVGPGRGPRAGASPPRLRPPPLPRSRAPREARLCRPALRRGGHRRCRSALSSHRGAPGRGARRHGADQLREGLPDLAQRVPTREQPARTGDRAALPGRRTRGTCTASPTSATTSSDAARPSSSSTPGSRRTGRRVRRSSITSAPRARSTTSCCSGRTGTTRASSGCRSSATGPSWCRRPKRTRRSGSTSLGDYFTLPAGYVFLTEEERDLVASRTRGPLPPSCVIGSGLAPAELPHPELRGELENMGVSFPYALYLGRLEKNKGCETLFRHYLRVRRAAPAGAAAGARRAGVHGGAEPFADPAARLRARAPPRDPARQRPDADHAVALREPQPRACSKRGTTACRRS